MKTYPAIAVAVIAGGCASFTGERFDIDAARDDAQQDVRAQWAVDIPEAPMTGDWTSQFDSAELEAVIAEALAANPDISAALATAEAAAQTARATYGRSLPSLTANAGTGYSGAANIKPSDSYDWGLSTSWEVDIWGRVASSNRAARADLDAAEADLADLRLSIAGAAARAWISLANARAQLALARDELKMREQSQTVTERRLSAGVSTSLDVRLARSATASTRASIASAERTLEDAARTLEVLLGRYPAAAVEAPASLPTLAPMASLSSPTELLSRRPDIAAAEARMAAAGLRADVARKAMRPALSLSASGGITAGEPEDLLDVDLLAGRVLANLTAPIFRGGALKADAAAARARAEAAAARYQSAILSAWQEVEGARSADLWLAVQEEALMVALEEAKAAESLANQQYQRGLITIFNLIDAQTRRISSERSLLNARAARAANRITYHLALGGGEETLPGVTDGNR